MADDDQRTEDERIQAMFQQNTDYWTQQQEQMASAAFVKRPAVQQQQMRPQPAQQGMVIGMNMGSNPRPYNPSAQHGSNIPPITQKPPTGYVCFKCGEPGHWIYYCPNYTKLAEDAQKTPKPFNQAFPDPSDSPHPRHPPPELVCRLCTRLMRDAVIAPCCGKSFCDECTYLLMPPSSRPPGGDGFVARVGVAGAALMCRYGLGLYRPRMFRNESAFVLVFSCAHNKLGWIGIRCRRREGGGRMRNHSHARMIFAWTASVTGSNDALSRFFFCLWDRESRATHYVGPLFSVSTRMLLTCLASFLS
ncbi:hypothetical protein BC937DRAFT_86418 [Endogone sp. FLAS-F59071]|nr:hypothetical protein BC937DRAFT_86418 [Endogone sp. FLAS-F59071]|eukprot:RUS13056.1 hypothetical protein BC937DRAFT_86418 [Endogone sp. FLAS-F59071]